MLSALIQMVSTLILRIARNIISVATEHLMSWLVPRERSGMMNWSIVTGQLMFNATLGQQLHQQLQDQRNQQILKELQHQQLQDLRNQAHLLQQQVLVLFVNYIFTK